MKLIVSSDHGAVVNVNNIRHFWIDISNQDAFIVCADEVDLSYHVKLDNAKKELRRLTGVISCQNSFLYQSENSQ